MNMLHACNNRCATQPPTTRKNGLDYDTDRQTDDPSLIFLSLSLSLSLSSRRLLAQKLRRRRATGRRAAQKADNFAGVEQARGKVCNRRVIRAGNILEPVRCRNLETEGKERKGKGEETATSQSNRQAKKTQVTLTGNPLVFFRSKKKERKKGRRNTLSLSMRVTRPSGALTISLV
jgi:hypothetical protein